MYFERERSRVQPIDRTFSSPFMSDASAPYLVVRVAGQLCALPVVQVIEVLRPPEDLALEAEDPGLLGMVTLRGAATAAFDLARLLGLRAGDQRATAGRLVSVRMQPHPVALLVDEVIGVRALHPASFARIDLPGARERVMGRFDAQLVQLLETSGIVPAELLTVRA
jgi:purine-binding chemotaxis protein CheW